MAGSGLLRLTAAASCVLIHGSRHLNFVYKWYRWKGTLHLVDIRGTSCPTHSAMRGMPPSVLLLVCPLDGRSFSDVLRRESTATIEGNNARIEQNQLARAVGQDGDPPTVESLAAQLADKPTQKLRP